MKNNKKIALIAGGGTGGHLFPALSIGEELQKNNVNVKYIGSIYGVEKEFFKNFNLDYHLLNITGIQRNFSIKSIYINCLFPIRFIISYIKSLLIIRSVKPSIIIGTGGYASGLPLIAGIHLNIPTLIQDQNSIPGLITKRLHNKIDRICLAYDLAADKLNKKKMCYYRKSNQNKSKKIWEKTSPRRAQTRYGNENNINSWRQPRCYSFK